MTVLGIALIVLAVLLILAGLVGSVAPILPGPPLAWSGLLVGFFSKFTHISVVALILTAILMIFVTVIDNIFPSMMTKKSGGTKAGSIGATVGLIAGFFFGIPGILLGPFLGALIFELIKDSSDFKKALKSARGAFLGFLLGTGVKMVAVGIFAWILFSSLDADFFQKSSETASSQAVSESI